MQGKCQGAYTDCATHQTVVQQSPGSQTPSAYLPFTVKAYLGQTHHETNRSISVTLGTGFFYFW